MPDFSYTAKNNDGKQVVGTIAAGSQREAISLLTRQSLFPTEVRAAGGPDFGWIGKKKVGGRLVASTLKQLADLLDNGVPMLSSLEILADQASNPTLKEIMEDIRDRVADGESIDSAFAMHPLTFSPLIISIIRAGSEGAFLEDAFKQTAGFMERQNDMKSKVVGAMIYPMVIMGFGTGVLILLLTYFVPKFQPIFDQVIDSGDTLPFPTIVILFLSTVLKSYWWQTILVIIGLGIWFKVSWAMPQVRRVVDRWKLKLPVIGKIMLSGSIARFCLVLGTLLKNGVPLLNSLEISSSSAGNQLMADAIDRAAENVSAGETLAKPLAEPQIIPKPIMAMIRIAEESNNLENVLVNISDTLEVEISRQLNVAISMIEPLMLVIVGGSVAFIIVGMLLPAFQLQG